MRNHVESGRAALLFKYEQMAAAGRERARENLRSFAGVWHASCSFAPADQIAIAHPMGTAHVCT
jgi:hypothetical protein